MIAVVDQYLMFSMLPNITVQADSNLISFLLCLKSTEVSKLNGSKGSMDLIEVPGQHNRKASAVSAASHTLEGEVFSLFMGNEK